MPFQKLILTVAVLALPLTAAGAAAAQSTGSAGAAQFPAGYGASRYTTAQPSSGSTRDANGNRPSDREAVSLAKTAAAARPAAHA